MVGTYLCPSCMNRCRSVDGPVCLYCRQRSLYGLTHPGCRRRQGIDGFVSLFRYDQLMKRILQRVKYHLATAVFEEFFLSIDPMKMQQLHAYHRLARAAVIQPIPLHPHRYRRRGFNQSARIASFLQNYTQYPIVSCLRRTRDTSPQALLHTPRERRENIRGAFEATGSVRPDIILVDDVVTIANTVQEAAGELKRAGAKRVFVFSLAQG